MPITLTPFVNSNLCHGNTWAVADENLLADQIARVALGQSRHVQKILAGANLAPPQTFASTVASAIDLLTVAAGDDPWHRDGWIFQTMSWIAAHRASPGGTIRPPHMILAHKGFDGLQVVLNNSTGEITAAIIFEDKATDNPRATIRDDVWPEFKKLEAGEKENVLTAEVTSLLQSKAGIDVDAAIQNIIWKQARHYRVSITIGDTHNSDKGRSRLFADYEKVAQGHLHRRRGETLHINNLRQWMDALAEKTIVAIKSMVP